MSVRAVIRAERTRSLSRVGRLFALLAGLLGCSERPPTLGGAEGPHRVTVRRNVSVPMSDGKRLEADLYLPADRSGPLPSLLIRLPYNRDWYTPATVPARFFASWGFATLVQDVRGRWGSEGTYRILTDDRADGAATVEWMTRQSWSNGRVGTFGCSNLGENQLVLAAERPAALRAMIPQGAGGAVGTLGGWNSAFAGIEGGALSLATMEGWFLDWGGVGRPAVAHPADRFTLAKSLPLVDMMAAAGVEDTEWRRYVTEAPGSAFWDDAGYLSDEDRFAAPGLHVNGWYDPGVAQTLALVDLIRARAADSTAAHQYAVIGPWGHCEHEGGRSDGRIGDLEVRGGGYEYWSLYRSWMEHWLGGGMAEVLDRPRFEFFVLGENRWRNSMAWPPEWATREEWFLALDEEGATGSLARTPPARGGAASFRYDPSDPVPSRGGTGCCSGIAGDEPGPFDRSQLDGRPDILRFASAPLERDLVLAGPIEAVLHVQSSAPDTDVTVHLVDVAPDGTALTVRDGIQRLRYRSDAVRPSFLDRGTRYEIRVRLADIAYRLPAGHRLRVDVSSSYFPRWDRNLNTDEPIGLGTRHDVAENTVHVGPGSLSRLIVFRAADEEPE